MTSTPTVPVRCANWSHDNTCTSEGSFSCSNCKLVAYCGPACQKQHWPSHKIECRSPLNKSGWVPEWDRTHRAPTWAIGEASRNLHNPFGSTKYLWGNVPAIDILQLSQNEGKRYRNNVKVLFAASGDLRNVFKTVRGIPESFDGDVEMTVNDWEFDVVARNAVMLLFLFASLNDTSFDQASYGSVAEALVHIWYSAFISSSLIASLKHRVGSLLHDSRTHTTETAHAGMIRKIWTFPRSKVLAITLPKDKWPLVIEYLEVPDGLTEQSAKEIRASVVMSQERADYRDRWFFKDATPSMRLAKQKFRSDGLLLPFGHPRIDFNVPNPTMFQTQNCWPFDDKADPLAGWCIKAVHKTTWMPPHDIYGKLFAHLHSELDAFLRRLSTLKVRLELLNVDATALPQLLVPQSYGRIEVSNISDAGYVGTRRILSLFAPLLETKSQNANATIITCYLNAVMEMAKMAGEADAMPDFEFLARYLPESLNIVKMLRQGADFYKVWDSRTLALDAEHYFDMYMQLQEFQAAADEAGLMMKRKNTIVQPWPLGLTLTPEDAGAQEEFDLLLSSCSSGVEHYVEWSRKR